MFRGELPCGRMFVQSVPTGARSSVALLSSVRCRTLGDHKTPPQLHIHASGVVQPWSGTDSPLRSESIHLRCWSIRPAIPEESDTDRGNPLTTHRRARDVFFVLDCTTLANDT